MIKRVWATIFVILVTGACGSSTQLRQNAPITEITTPEPSILSTTTTILPSPTTTTTILAPKPIPTTTTPPTQPYTHLGTTSADAKWYRHSTTNSCVETDTYSAAQFGDALILDPTCGRP